MNIIKYVCVRSFYIVTSYDFTSNHARIARPNFWNHTRIRTHTLHAFVRILRMLKERMPEKRNQHARTKTVTQTMGSVFWCVCVCRLMLKTVAGPACIKRVLFLGKQKAFSIHFKNIFKVMNTIFWCSQQFDAFFTPFFWSECVCVYFLLWSTFFSYFRSPFLLLSDFYFDISIFPHELSTNFNTLMAMPIPYKYCWKAQYLLDYCYYYLFILVSVSDLSMFCNAKQHSHSLALNCHIILSFSLFLRRFVTLFIYMWIDSFALDIIAVGIMLSIFRLLLLRCQN